MAKKLTYTEADAAFRHALYHFIVTHGHVPQIGELAAALSRSQKTLRSALQRLADLHILVLQQITSEVLRAAPLQGPPCDPKLISTACTTAPLLTRSVCGTGVYVQTRHP